MMPHLAVKRLRGLQLVRRHRLSFEECVAAFPSLWSQVAGSDDLTEVSRKAASTASSVHVSFQNVQQLWSGAPQDTAYWGHKASASKPGLQFLRCSSALATVVKSSGPMCMEVTPSTTCKAAAAASVSAPKELIFLCIASPTAGTEMARALSRNASSVYSSLCQSASERTTAEVFEFLSEFRRSFEAGRACSFLGLQGATCTDGSHRR